MMEKYKQLYNTYFKPNSVVKLLELGTGEGYSLVYWRNFFDPRSEIYGFDWANPKDEREHNRYLSLYADLERIHSLTIHIGDQSKHEDVKHFIDLHHNDIDFDIIIDDASHNLSDQQLTFYWLLPYVRIGGMYVIEDIHTSSFSHPGHTWSGLNQDGSNSSILMVKGFVETGKLVSQYFDGSSLEDKIKVDYFDNDIVFFRRVK